MNELRPVNRLPPEIFVKVFEVRGKEKDLDVATHVCARWRAILTSTPYLWTKIDFEYPARASIYLERSKSALIDVTVGKSRDSIIGPVGTFIGATPWVARMKSLSIQTDMEQIKKIAERLCQKTPYLESLTFEGKLRRYSYSSLGGGTGAGGAIYVPREFLGRHAPLLRSLTFRLVSPSVIFTFPLPKLTHIDWVAENAHVVIEELLDLFVSSPLLEDIRMHVLIRRTQMHRPLQTVTLKKLRKLDWADCDGSISLIPCLIAPELNHLTVKVTHNSQHRRNTLSSLLSSDRDHIPLLLEPAAVEYVYKYGNRSCRFSYGGNASLSVREVTKDRIVGSTINRWFSPDLPLSFLGTQDLTVEAAGGCPPLDDIPIQQFGSLQRLGFAAETDSLVPMIQLSRGISGNFLTTPCPELSEICITPKDHYFPLDGLAGVLRQRKEAGYGVKTIRIIGQYKCTRSQIDELRKLVDQVII